jgi:DNA-binding NarL/FixJ family response regulator
MPELGTRSVEILILDDHALFRESVTRLLNAEAGFHVVADCGSVDEALRALGENPVDIVLLDFDLGRDDGLDFIRAARRRGFQGKILVVTAGIERRQAADLIAAGIGGVFMKHNSAASLGRGIQNVMAGQVWLDQELLQEAWDASERESTPATSSHRLTDRERQVLWYVFEGLANKQIAGRLGVSESSVKATLQQLFAKTGVRTRSQLVRVVLEQRKDELSSRAPS